MNQENREYLTIGEIGKLTKTNPKSIRYYEQIGILAPAWIDPKTGYRYYRPDQIHHLFAIKTCIHFGIPLRDFPNYYKNGTLYAQRYLQDASANLNNRIQEILENISFLENLQANIGQGDQLIAEGGILDLPQPQRTFLIRDIPQDISRHRLFEIFTDLALIAKQLKIQREVVCGRIAAFRSGRLEHLYAAALVSADTDIHPVLTLPAGNYASLYTETPQILRAPDLFSMHNASGQEMLVFESTCISSQYSAENPGYILRCIRL
jgi:DNA-binding transcriptional MerR regulator